MTTTTAATTAANPSAGGYIVLAVILAAIWYLFAAGQGKAPTPVDIGRLGMSKLRGHGHENRRSDGDVNDDDDGAVDMPTSPQLPPRSVTLRPETLMPAGDDLREVLAARRRQLDMPVDLNEDDEDGDGEEPEPDAEDIEDRRAWVRARLRPGDSLRARYDTQRQFVAAAAKLHGVSEKTIYRDIEHVRAAQAARTARKDQIRRARK